MTANNYTTEVDCFDKDTWHQIIQRFSDNNIYQTWSYGAIRRGESKLSHLVLKHDHKIVAAAQLTILKAPIIRTGIAHVRFGPLWQLSGKETNLDHYAKMLQALSEEYVEKRGLMLRLKPWELQSDQLSGIRSTARFQQATYVPPYDTFVIDLSFTEEEHRKGLKRKWRHGLKYTQGHDLVFEEFNGEEALDTFLDLYTEMSDRKQFADFTDIQNLKKYYADLPPSLKPHILTCKREGKILAAIVCSVMGHYALALFGVTNPDGRQYGASYFLNWNVVNWLRQREGCLHYDLVGGIADPGVHYFKKGLVGKCGTLCHMHDYDAFKNKTNRFIFDSADRLRLASIELQKKLKR